MKKTISFLATLAILTLAVCVPVLANTGENSSIPFEPNGEIGFIYAHLVSAIDGTPFVSYFNETTGRVSHFTMQGEDKGFRYVDSVEDFWAMVAVNLDVTGRHARGWVLDFKGTFHAGYVDMVGIHINEYGERIDTYFDTVEEFEDFLAKHGLQSFADWEKEQQEMENLRERRLAELGFQSFEELYASLDSAEPQRITGRNFDFTSWYTLRHAGNPNPSVTGGQVSLGGYNRTGNNTRWLDAIHLGWAHDAIHLSRWMIFMRNAIGDDSRTWWDAPANSTQWMPLQWPGEHYQVWGSVFRHEFLNTTHRAQIRIFNW